MSWLQLRVFCDRAQAPALEAALQASGSLAVTLEDAGDEPLLEPAVGQTPIWRAVRVTGLYRADADMTPVLRELQLLPGGDPATVEILEDKDWEREWMQHYRPMRFGRRLWVCPSWLPTPDPEAINLRLDPGLAFGTGTHPTTALCLEALESLDLEGRSVVDFGCGSGILAIAAAKLGARRVLAVDNDPQALVATRDNAQRNSVSEDTLTVCAPDMYPRDQWWARSDVVVANILAGPLTELAGELCGLLVPSGALLLAGLLETQMSDLAEHYAPQLRLNVRSQREEWQCLEGRRH